eukprot:s278_g55.t1
MNPWAMDVNRGHVSQLPRAEPYSDKEDAGVVMSFVRDQPTGNSFCIVLDAATMTEKARIHFPQGHHIPLQPGMAMAPSSEHRSQESHEKSKAISRLPAPKNIVDCDLTPLFQRSQFELGPTLPESLFSARLAEI